MRVCVHACVYVGTRRLAYICELVQETSIASCVVVLTHTQFTLTANAMQEISIALCGVVLAYLPEFQSVGIEILHERELRDAAAMARSVCVCALRSTPLGRFLCLPR